MTPDAPDQGLAPSARPAARRRFLIDPGAVFGAAGFPVTGNRTGGC